MKRRRARARRVAVSITVRKKRRRRANVRMRKKRDNKWISMNSLMKLRSMAIFRKMTNQLLVPG